MMVSVKEFLIQDHSSNFKLKKLDFNNNFILVFIILISCASCSSPRLTLRVGGSETSVYEYAGKKNDLTENQLSNGDEEKKFGRVSSDKIYNKIATKPTLFIYPTIAFVTENNFGLGLDIDPIWIGINNLNSDSEIKNDSGTKFSALGIGLIPYIRIPLPLFSYYFGEGWSFKTFGLEIGKGQGTADLILQKCIAGLICKEGQQYENNFETVLNERVNNIEIEFVRLSLIQTKEEVEKVQRAMPTFLNFLNAPDWAKPDYTGMTISQYNYKIYASTKEEFWIKNSSIISNLFFGKLF